MYPRTVTAEVYDDVTDTLRVFQAEMEAYDAGGGPGDPRVSLQWEITGPVIELDEEGNEVARLKYADLLHDDEKIEQALVAAAEEDFEKARADSDGFYS